MKNLILVLIGFIFTTPVFAQPDFNEFKREKLKILNKEKQCLISSTNWKEYEKCKFKIAKKKYLFRLKMKELCIKKAKNWEDLKECKGMKYKEKQCEKCKRGEQKWQDL